jgi:hypothetical protein
MPRRQGLNRLQSMNRSGRTTTVNTLVGMIVGDVLEEGGEVTPPERNIATSGVVASDPGTCKTVAVW